MASDDIEFIIIASNYLLWTSVTVKERIAVKRPCNECVTRVGPANSKELMRPYTDLLETLR